MTAPRRAAKSCPVCLFATRGIHSDCCTPALRALVRAALAWDRAARGISPGLHIDELMRAVARFQKEAARAK
jgi:hypothetical protein